MPICDICGENLIKRELEIRQSDSIVKATSEGYSPRKLPAGWRAKRQMLGISSSALWQRIVTQNSSVKWGICASCAQDVDSFRPGKAQSKQPTTTVVSKEVEIARAFLEETTRTLLGNPTFVQSSATNKSVSTTASRDWFVDVSKRGGPFTPKDFNLFEIPNQSLDEWTQSISLDPRQVRCTVHRIRDLGQVTKALFETLEADHRLDTTAAVKIFDQHLSAACPKCLGGILGSALQMVAVGQSSFGVAGGGAGFQRILAGQCANCESDSYYVIWHGDKDYANEQVPIQGEEERMRDHARPKQIEVEVPNEEASATRTFEPHKLDESKRTPCKRCGASILIATALKNDGNCMRCSQEIQKTLSAATKAVPTPSRSGCVVLFALVLGLLAGGVCLAYAFIH